MKPLAPLRAPIQGPAAISYILSRRETRSSQQPSSLVERAARFDGGGAVITLGFARREGAKRQSVPLYFAGRPTEGYTVSIGMSNPLKARINSFMLGSRATVGPLTVMRAKAVLDLIPSDVPSPQIVPSVDGDVLFIWFHVGNQVQVNLDPDGHFTWFGKFDGLYEPGDDIEWKGSFPTAAHAMLRHLHG